MQTLELEANSMTEALAKLQRRLADCPLLVKSVVVRKGDLFGLSQKFRVEVRTTANVTRDAAFDCLDNHYAARPLMEGRLSQIEVLLALRGPRKIS
jgi:hypothetical protein